MRDESRVKVEGGKEWRMFKGRRSGRWLKDRRSGRRLKGREGVKLLRGGIRKRGVRMRRGWDETNEFVNFLYQDMVFEWR